MSGETAGSTPSNEGRGGKTVRTGQGRSKILLTRLVPPSILRSAGGARRKGRGRGQGHEGGAHLTAMAGLPCAQAVERARARLDEPEDAVRAALRGGGVHTFFFHSTEASLFGGMFARRRSGDPPLRHLNLSYGVADPGAMARQHASNPRIAPGGLRQWYQAAVAHRVVAPKPRRDLRLLPLGKDRLVRAPAGEVQGRTRKPIKGKGVPAVARSPWGRVLGDSPRLIVVGDVHGCIDELRALLKLADYQPGDQVVLLGDLVAKGPDSVGVVQLAREIGAKSVRGNHDHEVIRWFEAASRGGADAVVSLEHARIARALGAAEHAWLMDSPWFIESADMRHLFVHAGFIPGVKLTQQNPRLMMNMRSVLDDGTVTAKNVPACGWARLWRGPQTVVFGHDAFRGLQLYEYAKGIDTGCVYGGRLTALLLPENRFVSVPAKRPYVSSKRFRTREAARRMNVRYSDVRDDDLDRFVYNAGAAEL